MPLRFQGQPASPQFFWAEGFTLALRCEQEYGMLLLYGIISQGAELCAPILVRLVRVESAEVAGESLVEAGTFELGPIIPGMYHLEVLLPDRLVPLATVTLPLAAPSNEVD